MGKRDARRMGQYDAKLATSEARRKEDGRRLSAAVISNLESQEREVNLTAEVSRLKTAHLSMSRELAALNIKLATQRNTIDALRSQMTYLQTVLTDTRRELVAERESHETTKALLRQTSDALEMVSIEIEDIACA